MFITSQLWFSHQNELNDPYDCKYSLTDDFLISLFNKASVSLEKDLIKEIPNFQERIEKTILPMLKTEIWMGRFYNMLFGKRLGWSTCCFTTDPLNELMWAFYADNYKGVCLKFDFSKSLELHEFLNPVVYNNRLPEINSVDDLKKTILTKKKIWRFEKEWRILSKVSGKISFNKESLTSIYFGYKVKQTDIDNIKKLVTENGFDNVKFKQVKFRIKGVTINNIDDFDI